MGTSPEFNAILAVVLLSAFLVVLCWRRMAKWLKKGLLSLITGIGLISLGLFAPKKHVADDSTYLVTTKRGSTESLSLKSGTELNKEERIGANGAIALGGIFLLGACVVLFRRK